MAHSIKIVNINVEKKRNRFFVCFAAHLFWIPTPLPTPAYSFWSIMSSAKEQFLKFNTLSCLIGQCVGSITTVELRNEAFVTGKVVEVDGYMYVILFYKFFPLK